VKPQKDRFLPKIAFFDHFGVDLYQKTAVYQSWHHPNAPKLPNALETNAVKFPNHRDQGDSITLITLNHPRFRDQKTKSP